MQTKNNILIIGGTGIVGKAVIGEALPLGYDITVIGIKEDKSIPSQVKQIISDRKKRKEFAKIISKLNNDVGRWEFVLDVAEFEKADANQTYDLFKNHTNHFFIVTTVLVYDRNRPSSEPISTSHPLAKKGSLGGYVNHKLDIEHFWQKIRDANWTILRPYHILSPTDSLLGCIPDHNRDPKLIERIENNQPLVLCNGGEINLNFVDARDMAKVVLRASGNPRTFHKAYNVVNPQIISAKHYYELIGEMLGKRVAIKNKPMKKVWKENRGWQLTTLPHIYDVSDLKNDVGFVPSTSLEQSISEAVANYKPITLKPSQIAVHKRMTLLPRPRAIKWLVG